MLLLLLDGQCRGARKRTGIRSKHACNESRGLVNQRMRRQLGSDSINVELTCNDEPLELMT